jgi:hypothetical protein
MAGRRKFPPLLPSTKTIPSILSQSVYYLSYHNSLASHRRSLNCFYDTIHYKFSEDLFHQCDWNIGKLCLISCWQKMYMLVNCKIKLYHMSIKRKPYCSLGWYAIVLQVVFSVLKEHAASVFIVEPFTLKMEASGFSEMLVPHHQTTSHYIPEDHNLEVYCF